MKQALYDALNKLRSDIPQLSDLLQLSDEEELRFWKVMVDTKLLSRMAPDFPVVAAICGGGSSGKSTLFNSLVGEHFAPTGGTAGLNRRVLFSVPGRRAGQTDFLADLAKPFKDVPELLNDQQELLTPGKPLYVSNQGNSDNLVLLDTPDFDTGAKGVYTNREATRMALEAADILIYIFTNSNYNNRDNTDFIAQMLTGIGKRKCFLVYRVYPSFTAQEVLDHAMTVARGIYGESAEQYLLGIYRTDEDNKVASGQSLMNLRPAEPKDPPFLQALHSIDAAEIRLELYASILKDVCQRAGLIRNHAEVSLDKLRLYHDALQMAENHCIRDALKHFPMDHIMRRFARIWAKTDPKHVKIMRRTGNIIEFPLRMLISAAGWAKSQMAPPKSEPSSKKAYVKKLDEDLVTAVTSLQNQAVSPQLAVQSPHNDPATVSMAGTIEAVRNRQDLAKGQNPRIEPSVDGAGLTILIDAHPAVFEQQERLRAREFKTVLQSIMAEKETIVGISTEMEKDLKHLADEFREKMGVWRKISQTFWAFLNVLPATVALTYVISTGDLLVAAGIKVKLAGIFGLNDLYALFAIPFTTGLKKADRQQIEEMLGQILQTWLKDKSQKVQRLFEEYLTGGILLSARRSIADAEQLISEIDDLLLTLTEGTDSQ
ncbi:MAG: dynamin family protein [Desulfobacterales bacterium]|jgi:hypothetical protein